MDTNILGLGLSLFRKFKQFKKHDIGSLFIPRWSFNDELLQPTDFNELTRAYQSWVYVCVSKNSTAVAQQKLRLYVAVQNNKKIIGDTKPVKKEIKDYLFDTHSTANLNCLRKAVDIEEVVEHPFIDITKNVNQFTNRFDLWELTQMYLDLTGNAYWYLVNNELGVPGEIWILPAQFMTIIPDMKNLVRGYKYKNNSMTDSIVFSESEVIHFKCASPHSMLYGMSPLAGIAYAYDINHNMNKYEIAIFKNMGRLEGGFETTEEISEEYFERLKVELKQNYGGVDNAGKTPILDKGLTYKNYGLPPKDLNFLHGRKFTREEIAAAFDVPISKLTTDSVNRSNADAGERQYMRDGILPRLTRIEEKINEKIMNRYDENLFVAFDNPVPEDKEFALKEMTANLAANLTTKNEERAKKGLKPFEGGDIRYQPFNLVPMGTPMPQQGQDQGQDQNEEEKILEAAIIDKISKNIISQLRI